MTLLANTISPIMMISWGLLIFGNLFIGIVEGAVVAYIFRFPMARTIFLFIVANYCSMGVGALLFGLGERPSPLPDVLFEIPLHHATQIVWICVAVAFAVSVIIEWPFCWFAARPVKASMSRTWIAVFVAQCVTYPLLIVLLANESTNTIGDDVQVASLRQIISASDGGATVYFRGVDDGDLYRIDLDGSNLTYVQPLNAEAHAMLGWMPSDVGSWQLVIEQGTFDYQVLLEEVDGRCDSFWHDDSIVRLHSWTLGTAGVADLRHPEARDWRPEPRANAGMQALQEATGEELHITFDTPFASWWVMCVTVLPDDIVVFELRQQICVVSLPMRKIAFLAHGRGPVVLLHEPAEK